MTVRCEVHDCVNNDGDGYCMKERIDIWSGGVCGDHEVPESKEDE